MAFHRKGHESLTSRSVVLDAGLWELPHREIFHKERRTDISESVSHSWWTSLHPTPHIYPSPDHTLSSWTHMYQSLVEQV